MPYLITDDQGLPKPQYESENGSLFEAQKGKEGATFVYAKDGHNETLGKKDDLETSNSIVGIFKALKTIATAIQAALTAVKVKIEDMPGKSDTVRTSIATYGSTAIQGALTVDTSASELRLGGSMLAARRTVHIFNMSETVPIFVGFTSGTTVDTGFPVYPKTAHLISISSGSGLPVYAVASEAVQIRIVES